MKRFIITGSRFMFFMLLSIILLVLIAAYFGRNYIDLKIPKDKNILVLGNSHTECAINDQIVSNAYNFSRSGSAYFYEYLKLKEVLQQNEHVDTLVLAYGYFDLHKDRDLWFSGGNRIKYKIRNHFILFAQEDYISLLKSNYLDVLLYTPQTIFYSLVTSISGKSYLGGYKSLERNKLAEAKEILLDEEKPNAQLEISNYQSEYLLKIYKHCNANNIQLILLNAPIHPSEIEHLENLKPRYRQYAKRNMPKALRIDHSSFGLPDTHYADLNHLNKKGSVEYSKFLEKGNFTTKLEDNLIE